MNGFFNQANSFSLSAIQALQALAESMYIVDTPLFGARTVAPTERTGTIFASPTGGGDGSSYESPETLQNALALLNGGSNGNVLLLLDGTYSLTALGGGFDEVSITRSGSVGDEILIESYPNEWAVIDGSNAARGSATNQDDGGIRPDASNIQLRRFEVQYMVYFGVRTESSCTNFLAEGIISHHNMGTGIYHYSASGATIRDCKSYSNSDVGYSSSPYSNGQDSDGIVLSFATNGSIEYCTSRNNADDGFDCWSSDDMTYLRCYSHTNGQLGGDGNGNGFKMGSTSSSGNGAERCISFGNRSSGFAISSSVDTVYLNNTAYGNNTNHTDFQMGFEMAATATATDNITSNNWYPQDKTTGTQNDNSWNRSGNPEDITFESVIQGEPDFLYPTIDGGFEDIGIFSV